MTYGIYRIYIIDVYTPYPTSSVGNRPAENVLPNLSTTAVVPGSWAYGPRGQPNALASKGISKEFREWIAIAKDRPKWRPQTHSKPKPPDA